MTTEHPEQAPAGGPVAEISDDQLVAMLVDRARGTDLKLTGEGGLLQQLTKRILESALEGEITDHVGFDKHDKASNKRDNTRNGHRAKTVITDVGPVEIRVLRDVANTFEPQIVRKRQRRLTGVDELVLSLSAKGLTHGEIAAHLAEVYGTEVSKQTISTITDKVMDGMAEWQNRPLDRVYPVLFIDAINVKIRDGHVANRPVYVALAVTAEGHRDILGIWAGDGGEGAKYWLHVLTEIKNRGVQDVLMLVCDGLKGLPEAVETVWPKTIVQTCVVHRTRKRTSCCLSIRSSLILYDGYRGRPGSTVGQMRCAAAPPERAAAAAHAGYRGATTRTRRCPDGRPGRGASETTVRKGVFELEAGEGLLPKGRVRRPGGGRKTAAHLDSGLTPALLALVEPDERGDPMSPLRWTTKSLRNLTGELTRQGHRVSAMTVGNLLKANGFSLQAQAKVLEGQQHPDRDAQFRYINEQVKQHQATGDPVISVDTKKKEMLGQLPNPGRQWRPKGDPVKVDDHSFFSGPTGDAAIPYGVYDLTADSGWVTVGVDHDTSTFAVSSIRRWWQARGHLDYPHARRLLITADAGGSNGYRYRVWKAELAKLASETSQQITVCHFPPGTSKWNKIEHRLFSHITMNWRGRPLTSHDVVVACIAATTTQAGLRVHAELDTAAYPLGMAISKAQLKALPIEAHAERGIWNYTVRPDTGTQQPPPARDGGQQHRRRVLDLLNDPRLTGMSSDDLTTITSRLAPQLAALREERLHRLRGGPRRQATADHKIPLLSHQDQVLLTVLYLRHVSSQNVLAEMLGLNPRTISTPIKQIRRLLQEHGITLTPTTLCFDTGRQIEDFLHTDTPVTARQQLTHALADPHLTGMSRTDLNQLIDRLSLQQAALIEKRRHRQRGGPRQPGTRGGVFRQKITDAERMLAAVLYERKLATRHVLAAAFNVSLSTLNNALADALPILREGTHHRRPSHQPLRKRRTTPGIHRYPPAPCRHADNLIPYSSTCCETRSNTRPGRTTRRSPAR